LKQREYVAVSLDALYAYNGLFFWKPQMELELYVAHLKKLENDT
jgi:hypothetical protein